MLSAARVLWGATWAQVRVRLCPARPPAWRRRRSRWRRWRRRHDQAPAAPRLRRARPRCAAASHGCSLATGAGVAGGEHLVPCCVTGVRRPTARRRRSSSRRRREPCRVDARGRWRRWREKRARGKAGERADRRRWRRGRHHRCDQLTPFTACCECASVLPLRCHTNAGAATASAGRATPSPRDHGQGPEPTVAERAMQLAATMSPRDTLSAARLRERPEWGAAGQEARRRVLEEERARQAAREAWRREADRRMEEGLRAAGQWAGADGATRGVEEGAGGWGRAAMPHLAGTRSRSRTPSPRGGGGRGGGGGGGGGWSPRQQSPGRGAGAGGGGGAAGRGRQPAGQQPRRGWLSESNSPSPEASYGQAGGYGGGYGGSSAHGPQSPPLSPQQAPPSQAPPLPR